MGTITATPGTLPPIVLSAPVRKKDITDVTASYAAERPFSFLKAIYVLGIDVPKAAGLIPEEHMKAFDDTRHYLNLAKLLEFPGKLLKNSNTLRNRTVDLIDRGLSWTGAYEWFRAANGMVNPTNDAVEFLTKSSIVHVAKDSIASLKAVNACAMVFGFGTMAIDSLLYLFRDGVNDNKVDSTTGEVQEVEREKAISAMLKLAYDVSLCTLGVLTVLSIFFSVVVSPTAFLICSASSVVFHITKYFYENIGPGMKKIETKGIICQQQ